MHEKMDIFYLTSKKTANIYRTIYPTASRVHTPADKKGRCIKGPCTGWLLHIFLLHRRVAAQQRPP